MTRTNALTRGSILAVLLAGSAVTAFAGSQVLVTGGGIIKEGNGPDVRRITFSMNVFVDADELASGHLQFNFHEMNDLYNLDKSRFTSSEFASVLLETHDFESTPYTFVRIEADGQLDGEDGWSVLARFSDFGVPVGSPTLPDNHADAVRVVLFSPDGSLVYDTASDFPRDQSWRTILDGGNVVTHILMESSID